MWPGSPPASSVLLCINPIGRWAHTHLFYYSTSLYGAGVCLCFVLWLEVPWPIHLQQRFHKRDKQEIDMVVKSGEGLFFKCHSRHAISPPTSGPVVHNGRLCFVLMHHRLGSVVYKAHCEQNTGHSNCLGRL